MGVSSFQAFMWIKSAGQLAVNKLAAYGIWLSNSNQLEKK